MQANNSHHIAPHIKSQVDNMESKTEHPSSPFLKLSVPQITLLCPDLSNNPANTV